MYCVQFLKRHHSNCCFFCFYATKFQIFKIGLDKRVETFLPEKQECTEFPTETANNWQECIKKEAK